MTTGYRLGEAGKPGTGLPGAREGWVRPVTRVRRDLRTVCNKRAVLSTVSLWEFEQLQEANTPISLLTQGHGGWTGPPGGTGAVLVPACTLRQQAGDFRRNLSWEPDPIAAGGHHGAGVVPPRLAPCAPLLSAVCSPLADKAAFGLTVPPISRGVSSAAGAPAHTWLTCPELPSATPLGGSVSTWCSGPFPAGGRSGSRMCESGLNRLPITLSCPQATHKGWSLPGLRWLRPALDQDQAGLRL